jgi:hypothetical protein
VTDLLANLTNRDTTIKLEASRLEALEVLLSVFRPALGMNRTFRLVAELQGQNILLIDLATKRDESVDIVLLFLLGDEVDLEVILAKGLLELVRLDRLNVRVLEAEVVHEAAVGLECL